MEKQKTQLPIVENSDVGIIRFCVRTLFEHENDGLADTLIQRFGGATGVFEASFEELMSVKGMTERAATFFSVMPRLRRTAMLRLVGDALESERDIVQYAAVYFMNDRKPSDVCVCLDKNNKIICAEKLTETERVREIASIACGHNAKKVLLLRHEPRLTEKARAIAPHPETQRLLIKIIRLLNTLEIELVDYMEYGSFAFFSYARAVDGDIGVFGADGAKGDKYDPPDWTTSAGSYYEYCIRQGIAKNLETQNRE